MYCTNDKNTRGLYELATKVKSVPNECAYMEIDYKFDTCVVGMSAPAITSHRIP